MATSREDNGIKVEQGSENEGIKDQIDEKRDRSVREVECG